MNARDQVRGTLALSIVLALAGPACRGRPAAQRQEPEAAVAIDLFSFKPKRLEVNAGTTVTWTQSDDTIHTVTSGTVEELPDGRVARHPNGRFDSGDLVQGATYRFTFKRSGSYLYFCSYHPEGMRAEIVVEQRPAN